MEKKTPLHPVVLNHNNRDMVDTVLDNNEDIDARDSSLKTPFHLAVDTGHINFLNLLIERGADISAVGTIGWTRLHHAVSQGHQTSALMSLKRNGNHTSLNNVGQTITYVGQHGHLELAFLLFQMSYTYENSLFEASRDVFGWSENSQFSMTSTSLLDGSAIIDECNTLGETHLVTSARTGPSLSYGTAGSNANIDAISNSVMQYPALHTAVIAGHRNVVDALLDTWGVSLELIDRDRRTMLHVTANSGGKRCRDRRV